MPEAQRVLDDHINPVDIVARLGCVGPMRNMGQLHRQPFGRAGLHDVTQVNVAFPVPSAIALLKQVFID